MALRLSKKHGLNPSIGVCPICLKDNQEILLLGKLPGDAEAPMRVPSNICNECKSKIEEGFYPLVVIKDIPERMVKNGLISMEDAKREGHILFVKKESMSNVPDSLFSYIPESLYRQMVNNTGEKNPEEDK